MIFLLAFSCSQPDPLSISVSFPQIIENRTPIMGSLSYAVNIPENDSIKELSFTTNYSDRMADLHYPYMNDAFGADLNPEKNAIPLFIDLFYLTPDSPGNLTSSDTIILTISITLKTSRGINTTRSSSHVIKHLLNESMDSRTDTIRGWYYKEDVIIANWSNGVKNGKVDIKGRFGKASLNYTEGVLDGEQYVRGTSGDTASISLFDHGTELEVKYLIDTSSIRYLENTYSNAQ